MSAFKFDLSKLDVESSSCPPVISSLSVGGAMRKLSGSAGGGASSCFKLGALKIAEDEDDDEDAIVENMDAFDKDLEETKDSSGMISGDATMEMEDSPDAKVKKLIRDAMPVTDFMERKWEEHIFTEWRDLAKATKVMDESNTLFVPPLEVAETRNRFADILPLKRTRVKLIKSPFPEFNKDYINANFVKSKLHGSTMRYIAAQGPTEDSKSEFWTMIFERNSTLIVMLTALEEGTQSKCIKYWPDDPAVPLKAGDYTIKLEAEVCDPKTKGEVIVRTFSIKEELSGKEKEVTHIQYVAWPDKSVPEDMNSFKRLFQVYRERRALIRRKSKLAGIEDRDQPVTLHCTAGVGRTGTFIAIDILLDNLLSQLQSQVHTPKINVPALVIELRYQRQRMIQSMSQYEFLYNFVHFCLDKNELFGDDDLERRRKSLSATATSSKRFSFSFTFKKSKVEVPAAKE